MQQQQVPDILRPVLDEMRRGYRRIGIEIAGLRQKPDRHQRIQK